MIDLETLHAGTVVIDATAPLLTQPQRRFIDAYRAGGVTAVAATVGSSEDCRGALGLVAPWLRTIRESDDLLLVRTAADIEAAKRQDKLGIILHFQGADPVEADLDLVDLFKTVGVGIIQLTYNVRNRVGDGCEEPSNSGLSRFGRRLVERMNRCGVIVDCSHTGERTTLDAVEVSSQPVILSHANAKAVFDAPRNVSDEVYRAIAASGGVIGILGFPPWVGRTTRPSFDAFAAHIDHVVGLVGIDHVGLGIDYFTTQHPYGSDEAFAAMRAAFVASGAWSPEYYPAGPYHYPEGIETPDRFAGMTRGLAARGYGAEDIRKILGGNWLRVYRTVWG